MIYKYNTSFSLKKSATPADEKCNGDRDYPIRMRITYCGQRLDYPVRLSINKKYWDAEKQKVTKKGVNANGITADEINAHMAELTSIVNDIIKTFQIKKIKPSNDLLKNAIDQTIETGVINLSSEKTKKISLSEAYEAFMNETGAKNSWTKATYEKHNAIKTDLNEFNPKLSFDDMTEETLTNFVIFLREQKVVSPEKKDKNGKVIKEAVKGLKNSTVGKKMGFLNWFMNWATSKGYNKNNDYKTFKPKLKSTQATVVFLTEDEIEQLSIYQIPEEKKHLETVRDAFILCCYTGIRHSDLKNLKKGDVKDDHIEITTIKTSDSLRIELNDTSKRILDKYKEIHLPNDAALPVLSNQKMNDALKELCKLANINQEIKKTYFKGNERIEERGPKYDFVSTHTGRKSFICNALAKGISAEVIMKWTGHSDFKAMKPYIAIADETKAREMKKFNIKGI